MTAWSDAPAQPVEPWVDASPRAVHGIIFALALSLPLWGAFIWLLWALLRFSL